jgi:hypothetical protein
MSMVIPIRSPRIIAMIFGGIGLIFLVVGSGIGIHTALFLRRAKGAEGVVTYLDQQRGTNTRGGSSNSIYYAPRFRFQAEDGTQREIQSRTGSNPPRFHVGDVVPIRYDPAAPNTATIATFGQLWFLPMISFGLGSLLVMVGILIVIKMR